jgi:hypothetical protein
VHRGPSAESTQSRERGRLRYEQALARLRHEQALARLRAAGIPTREDPEAGACKYVELRARREPDIETVAPAPGYRMEEWTGQVTARPRARPAEDRPPLKEGTVWGVPRDAT